MPYEEKASSSGQTQFILAIIVLLIGLFMLVTWIVLYSYYKDKGFSIPWWIWFFLGFGLALVLGGIVWLIIASYAMSSKLHKQCEEIWDLRKKHEHEEVIREEGPGGTTERRQYYSQSPEGTRYHRRATSDIY